MNRIVIKGLPSAFKAPFLANRSISVVGNGVSGVLGRSFSNAAGDKKKEAAPARTPVDPEV